jgi:hypothetical protein
MDNAKELLSRVKSLLDRGDTGREDTIFLLYLRADLNSGRTPRERHYQRVAQIEMEMGQTPESQKPKPKRKQKPKRKPKSRPKSRRR